MRRAFAAFAGCLFTLTTAAAMVGGAPPADGDVAHASVLLVGSRGTSCTGVAIAGDLVMTAAHCVLPGADYKLVERDASGAPKLRDIATIARHPQFDANAAVRHRVTADIALLKFAAPLRNAPASLAPVGASVAVGDLLVVAGYGVTVPEDGKSGGVLRAATLVVTGQPGSLQFRLIDPAARNERAGLGACAGDSGASVFRALAGTLAVIGVVSWSAGPKNSAGCGGITGVAPLARYRAWIVETAAKLRSPLS